MSRDTRHFKQRLDQRLHTLGLTESRERARRLIMAGEVTVDGQVVVSPAAAVAAAAVIEIKARPRFASRGGEKLDAALEHFKIDVAGLVCADAGASTGGFTDCLLQHGAARVYAIDVGHGILDYRLRADPRVVVMEDTNARYLEHLPEPVQFVSVDASFISLKLLLPVVKGWMTSPLTPAPSEPPLPPLPTERRERGEGQGVGGINSALIEFLQERWKGLRPVMWGANLRQLELDLNIYRNLLGADRLPTARAPEVYPTEKTA